MKQWTGTNPPSTDVEFSNHDLDLMEKGILKNIHAELNSPRINFYNRAFFKVAASIFLFCTISFYFYQQSEDLITISAAKGKVTEMYLPDGSKVWLNAGSKISYPKDFAKNRSIYLLTGEAFFDVKHQKHQPFIVHYGDVYVKVLGTAFNVKAYQEFDDVRVTVLRGKVEVGDQKERFDILVPGKEIILESKKEKHFTHSVASEKVSAWKNNEVNLYDVSFEELILVLQNTYDLTIDYPEEKMSGIVTTIQFSKEDKIKDVLDVIKMIHGLDYTIEGKEVILKD